MTTHPTLPVDSPLAVHAKQLILLDRMMAEGDGDSPDSDALRDAMDTTWRQMRPEEIEIARQLSADLYTLHDDPLVSHSKNPNCYTRELACELTTAFEKGDFVSALRLLQSRPSEISWERAALFRAILYRSLGLPEVALIFFEQVAPPAVRSDSQNMPLLGFLWQHVNLDTAPAAAFAGQFFSTPS